MVTQHQLGGLLEGIHGTPAERIADWTDHDLILYGAGSGYDTFNSFVLAKYSWLPTKILDQRFSGSTEFRGIPAGDLSSLTDNNQQTSDAVVIITLGKPALATALKQTFRELGYQNVFWAFDFFEYSLHHTPISTMNSLEKLLRNESSNIKQAYQLMSDEESQTLFRKILATYARSEIITLPSRPIDEQYFAEDILHKGFSCFIDCGAYTGDTIDEMVKRGVSPQTVACFEPDPENYARLTANPNLKKASRVETFPCALGASESVLSLSSNNTNSSVVAGGDIQIRSVAIDDVIGDLAPTYIKMDIEGAEPEALIGAQQTIHRHHPDLAISIYHLVDHLWRLPLLISSMGSGYRLYLIHLRDRAVRQL